MPALLVAAGLAGWQRSNVAVPPAIAPAAHAEPASVQKFVTQHCIGCHNSENRRGGLALDAIIAEDVGKHAAAWEKVVRKASTRQMPPMGKPRPDEKSYAAFVAALEDALDRAASARPNPGRTVTLRRLNRLEYQNAVRDLLALDLDAAALLPADEANHGFDSAPLGDLSPTLLERYIAAAQKISRLAVGTPSTTPNSETFRTKPDLTQEGHVEGLPLGTRGGMLIPYAFPQEGEYDVQVWLTRDRNEKLEGLNEAHELEVLLDGERRAYFTVKPPTKGQSDEQVDKNLKARVKVSAGPHALGVTFVKNLASLAETRRQPYQAHYNLHRHPRRTPAVYQVTITGPYNARGHGDTPSRRRVFVCQPTGPADEDDCAKKILSALLRRAYRKPVTEANLDKAMKFYRQGRKEAGFDAGIVTAISAILVNPQFLFRVEADPTGVAPNTPYRVSDLDLASRVSFFLWSTIPDDELLDLAERNELRKPDVLEKQVRRMLADARSRNLAGNFAAQWLHLRNLDSITPDLRLFPDFDDNLRQAFRQETELLVDSVLREDRSVLQLLNADFTFLNERLAKHYGVAHIYGDQFRRVALDAGRQRGGLLRQGSILTVTSYATRTSPVVRGKWILENLIGTPPPPPPEQVPPLKENTIGTNLTVRERLARHRADAACASCHQLIDPVGFALEQFDAVGRWRAREDGQPVDATGGLPDGSQFEGVTGLEKALQARPEWFVRTLTEKLFTFALGRPPEHHDAPAIRKIIRDARANDYRFSSLIVGLATSTPFQMRMSP
jgi:mono/diheme cytochrome c family protein